VFANTDDRKAILDYQPWYIKKDNSLQAVKIKAGRLQGKLVVAQLEGVDDRTIAETWVGLDIYIPKEQLARLGKDEFYWSELIGLTVETTSGVILGQVDHMLETGANDVLVVKGDKERLIPFVMHKVVVEVDSDGQRMVVDWDPDF
jgi:16S rRNA processing protein RimM